MLAMQANIDQQLEMESCATPRRGREDSIETSAIRFGGLIHAFCPMSSDDNSGPDDCTGKVCVIVILACTPATIVERATGKSNALLDDFERSNISPRTPAIGSADTTMSKKDFRPFPPNQGHLRYWTESKVLGRRLSGPPAVLRRCCLHGASSLPTDAVSPSSILVTSNR